MISEISAGAPVWVHPALMEQALFNVIGNAAELSPAGESIRIDARRIGADSICIEIIDRGPGPRPIVHMFFEKLHIVERSDPGQNGTGFGLGICSRMVGAHGGTVVALAPASGDGMMFASRCHCGFAIPAEKTRER
ncbi:MAG: ATP-binding protein [Rhodanobacteraceae bacterium]